MVSTSNREWKSGMNESELVYKSSYKTLDKAVKWIKDYNKYPINH